MVTVGFNEQDYALAFGVEPVGVREFGLRLRGDIPATTAVCTGNPQDFPMPELAVQHWPVGE